MGAASNLPLEITARTGPIACMLAEHDSAPRLEAEMQMHVHLETA